MLKNISIKYKITIITLLVSIVTLFAAMSVLFVFDLFNKEEEMHAQLEQKARQIHEKTKILYAITPFHV
jgi:flagellar basal body-associated protein FliL